MARSWAWQLCTPVIYWPLHACNVDSHVQGEASCQLQLLLTNIRWDTMPLELTECMARIAPCGKELGVGRDCTWWRGAGRGGRRGPGRPPPSWAGARTPGTAGTGPPALPSSAPICASAVRCPAALHVRPRQHANASHNSHSQHICMQLQRAAQHATSHLSFS